MRAQVVYVLAVAVTRLVKCRPASGDNIPMPAAAVYPSQHFGRTQTQKPRKLSVVSHNLRQPCSSRCTSTSGCFNTGVAKNTIQQLRRVCCYRLQESRASTLHAAQNPRDPQQLV